MFKQSSTPIEHLQCSTIEAAKLLGLAVRSIQLMVDRGDLKAWKTPGGHRRISRESVQAWLQTREIHPAHQLVSQTNDAAFTTTPSVKLLIIDTDLDSRNQLSEFFKEKLPNYQIHFSSDPILGLTMVDAIKPSAIVFSLPLTEVNFIKLLQSLQSKPYFSNYPMLAIDSDQSPSNYGSELKNRNISLVRREHLSVQLETLFPK